jgi:hypothetical protein
MLIQFNDLHHVLIDCHAARLHQVVLANIPLAILLHVFPLLYHSPISAIRGLFISTIFAR